MANNSLSFSITLDAAQAQAALAAFTSQLAQTTSSVAGAQLKNPFATITANSGQAITAVNALSLAFKGMAGSAVAAFAVDAYKAANAAETAFYSLQSAAKATGDSFSSLWGIAQKISADGLIPEADAAAAVKTLRTMGYSIEQVSTMMERMKELSAFDTAKQFGGDRGLAIRTMAEGMKNFNSQTSDSLGLTENLSVVFEKYAAKLHTTANLLTDLDKNQAMYQWLLKGSEGAVGNVAKLMSTNEGATLQFENSLKRLKIVIGSELAPAFTPLIEALTPFMQVLALGVRGIGEAIKSLFITVSAFRSSHSWGEFTDKLSKEDDARQQRMLPAVESARKAMGMEVGSDVMNPDGTPKLKDYRGPRMIAAEASAAAANAGGLAGPKTIAGMGTVAQADVIATIGLPDPKLGLPRVVAPLSDGKKVNGPTLSTQGASDTVDPAKAAKVQAEKDAEETRQRAAQNMEKVKLEIEAAKNESDNKIAILKAELATKAQLRSEAVDNEKMTAAEAAKEAQKDSLKQLDMEYEERKKIIVKVGAAQMEAIVANNPKAAQEYRLQMDTLLTEQKANIEKRQELESKARQDVFDGNRTTNEKFRKLKETDLEAQLKTELDLFTAKNEKELSELEALHNEKLISEADYLDRLAKLQLEKPEMERKQANARKAFAEAQTPLNKQDAAELAAKVQEQTAIVKAADEATKRIEAERDSKKRLSVIELAKLQRELDADLMAAEGKDLEAKIAQIDNWLEQKKQELKGQDASLLAKAEAIAAAQKKSAKFDDTLQQIGYGNNDTDRALKEAQLKNKQGLLDDIAYEETTLRLKKAQVAVLKERLAVLKENANESDQEKEQIKALESQINELDSTTNAVAQSINDNFFNALKQGFSDLFTGAKKPLEALRDVAISVLRQIADMAFKVGLQKMFGNSLFGDGGLGGSIAGWLGGGSGGGGGLGSLFGGALATGGDMQDGKAYLVGEKGPELVFPGVNGRVVTNSELNGAVAGLMSRQVPAPMSARSLPEMAQAATGDQHIHVKPQVTISSAEIVNALRQDPQFESMHVQLSIANGKKIQSRW